VIIDDSPDFEKSRKTTKNREIPCSSNNDNNNSTNKPNIISIINCKTFFDIIGGQSEESPKIPEKPINNIKLINSYASQLSAGDRLNCEGTLHGRSVLSQIALSPPISWNRKSSQF